MNIKTDIQNLEELSLNELFGSAQRPINNHFSRFIFLVLNDAGDILKMWYPPRYSYPEVVQQIRASRNIFQDFTSDKECSLKQLFQKKAKDPDAVLPLHSLPGKFSIEGITGFHMTLPNCVLIVNPLKNGLFLGTVHITNLLPNSYYRDIGSVIFVDQNDRLQGFNDTFFTHFQARFKSPLELLKRPCNELMSPTPRMLQQDYFKSLYAPDKGLYQTVFELETALPKSEQFPDKALSKKQGVWYWESTDEDYRYITLLDPIDCKKKDFIFEVTFNAVKGYLPIVILGQKKQGTHMPDYNGYTFGVDVGTNKIFVKKYGYVLGLSERAHPETGRSITYTLRKTGQALLFYINGKEYLKYYDFDFIQNNSAFISLGLRMFSSVELKEGALLTAEITGGKESTPVVIKMNTETPAYYTLNQFYNESLSTNFPHVHGFILQNVTRFREDVERYQEMYTNERKRGQVLNSLVDKFRGRDDLFLGDSPAIRTIKEKADVIAGSDATVLIQGETGTGKEVLARFIHANGPFREGPFVKVDCSTLSPTLVESELFGHERGAFTGAIQSARGKFEQADRGTLFIDEVNNLSFDMQAKILNFLQDRTITRVGGEKPLKLELRIIIASNIQLEEMIENGLFREDLYYRINIVNIQLPPLKDRREDIPLLCDYFIKMFSLQHNKEIKGLSYSTHKRIEGYDWPGNVRELKNAIQRAVIFCQKDTIDDYLIEVSESVLSGKEAATRSTSSKKSSLPHRRRKKKTKTPSKRDIIHALKKHGGNVRRAAETLGVERLTVYYNMKKHNIDADRFRK